jgi:ABC-type Zn uptake system ZnuABC Zn-binding protein ZnuA
MKSQSEEEEENVHGFVDPNNLLTYKKRYREKIEELRNQQKEKYQNNRKVKSEEEKLIKRN